MNVPSYQILTDEDITKLLSMRDIVQKIEDAIKEKANGTLYAPPRFALEVDRGGLVFTAGAAVGYEKVMGFRVYDTFPGEHPERTQLLAVFDTETGAFKGIVVGEAVGAMRTGAIGGVAVKYMSRIDAKHLAVLGTGRQARTQLEAAVVVRNFKTVKVYSPNPENRRRFAYEIEKKLGIEIETVDSARECVEDADVILCATNSFQPVFDVNWIKPGAHINTVGPKAVGAHELPMEIADRSHVIATDSLAQIHSYKRPHFITTLPKAESIIELSEIVVGKAKGRYSPEDISLFCSVGLAGTEVVVAGEAINRATNISVSY
jgi:alanine dehydrogenase